MSIAKWKEERRQESGSAHIFGYLRKGGERPGPGKIGRDLGDRFRFSGEPDETRIFNEVYSSDLSSFGVWLAGEAPDTACTIKCIVYRGHRGGGKGKFGYRGRAVHVCDGEYVEWYADGSRMIKCEPGTIKCERTIHEGDDPMNDMVMLVDLVFIKLAQEAGIVEPIRLQLKGKWDVGEFYNTLWRWYEKGARILPNGEKIYPDLTRFPWQLKRVRNIRQRPDPKNNTRVLGEFWDVVLTPSPDYVAWQAQLYEHERQQMLSAQPTYTMLDQPQKPVAALDAPQEWEVIEDWEPVESDELVILPSNNLPDNPTAQEVIEHLRGLAKSYRGQDPHNKKGLTIGGLTSCFTGNAQEVRAQRHKFTKRVFGVESSKGWTGEHVLALHEFLDVSKEHGKGNRPVPNPRSVELVRLVVES